GYGGRGGYGGGGRGNQGMGFRFLVSSVESLLSLNLLMI
ncbi:unnamed protein product, partial [Brassica oleracea]